MEPVTNKLERALAWLKAKPGVYENIGELMQMHRWISNQGVENRAFAEGSTVLFQETYRWLDRRINQSYRDAQARGLTRTKDPKTHDKPDIVDLYKFSDRSVMSMFARMNPEGHDDESFANAIAQAKFEGSVSRDTMHYIFTGRPRHVPPPPQPRITDRSGQRRALDGACLTLSGITHGLQQIGAIDGSFTLDDLAKWEACLAKARREISRTIKKIKEVSE